MIYKYTIISNDYLESQNIKKELLAILQGKDQFQLSTDLTVPPDFVFVIGGDGTFLATIQKYSHSLDKTVFIPIKFGGIGFYTSHNLLQNCHQIVELLLQEQMNIFEYRLLEIFSGTKHFRSLNEIKIVNNVRPLSLDIYVNDHFLETFRGTGLVFSTPSGSTGFAKTAGGAILYPNTTLYEMLELFPVSTNKFRTVTAPIVFSKDQIITIKLQDLANVFLSVDTVNAIIANKNLTIKLSDLTVKVLSLSKEKMTKTTLLNNIFVLNDTTKTTN